MAQVSDLGITVKLAVLYLCENVKFQKCVLFFLEKKNFFANSEQCFHVFPAFSSSILAALAFIEMSFTFDIYGFSLDIWIQNWKELENVVHFQSAEL